jgi:putative PEP-CTERM system TPR-repeat lipoprotein
MMVAVCLTLGACGKSETDVISSAKAHLDKRDVKTATVELKALLQKTPQSGEGRYLLGRALLESGDLAGAEAELNRALENKYSDEIVAPVMAQVLYSQRQYRKLTDRYAKFEVADAQAATTLKVILGLAFAAQGQKDEAHVAIKRALEIKPDSVDANVAQARLLASDGKADDALKQLDGLLAKVPNATDALQLKGNLLQQTKGDLAGAVQVYRKALEVRSDLPEAHAALIAAAFAQRDVDGAAKQLEELKKVLPNHPQTKYFEAQVAFAKGDFAKARELVQPLLRAAPEHAGLLHLAGATEFKLNATAQAESYLSKAIQVAPNFAGARRMLAQVHLRARQPSKVQVVLKPIIDSGHADSESLSLMAQAAAMLGDTKSADEFFARASKLKPDDTRIRAAQALGQVSRGNADTAFAELENLAAGDKGSAVDLALISAHLQRNEWPAALKAIDALDKKQPGSAIAPNLRGRLLLQQKDLAGARKNFEMALQRDPKFVAAAAALAALDFNDKKPDAAKARFETLLKVDPKNAQAMLAMSELSARAGDKPEVVLKWINDAIAAEPSNPAARQVLVDHHLRVRDFKTAAAAAQAAVVAIPNNPDLVDKQARVLLAAGDAQQAMTSFSRVTQLRPESAQAFLNLGEAQLGANDLDGAARAARRALELQPAMPAAQRLSISVAVKQQRWKDALAVARDMQARQPADSAGLLVEGEIELEQKNYDAAIAAFRKACAMASPGQGPARLHAALMLAKRDAEAAKFVDSWAVSHPKDGLFQYYLGDVALGKNDYPAAERRYNEVLKLQPEHALALNNVAWLMVQQKRTGAVALAERAVKAAPNQPPLMDTLALALAAESQLPKAIEVQKQVVAMAPQAPSFRLNLARMLVQSGDKAAARTELQALEKLGIAFAGHTEVADLLKKLGS